MAKFKRFDPRNKKSNKHKQKSKDGFNFKRIKNVEVKTKYYDEESEKIST